ncbi:MAG TPA: HupE/UreJ family protein [Candidatus Udaeobacter sp.]|nr:HupE/UreJ family protein [Candidatus Udaeobacter sp.]
MDFWNPGQVASSRLAGSDAVLGAILVILFSLLSIQDAAAHDPGLSSLTIRQRTKSLEATLTLAVKDAAQVAELDEDHDGIVTQAEFAQTRSQLETAVARQLLIAADDKVTNGQSVRSQLDENNNVEVRLNFHVVGFSSLEIQSKIIASLPLGHRQYLQIQNSLGETTFERLLSAAADRATVQMPHTNARTAMFEAARSFANFLSLGVKHILTGYDHLLFLFGLLLVARGFFSSLGIITSFTIAHSITLAVATLHLVQIPSRIVEPLIAASIVFVGVENLLRGDIPKARRIVPFGFGLIHGFGFASALREAGIGSGTGGILLPLFSFNLGVELGQIMVAAIALPIIWKLRENPMFIARWAPACSAAVVLLGSFWFVQRVWMT